jgi:hypothetical protein
VQNKEERGYGRKGRCRRLLAPSSTHDSHLLNKYSEQFEKVLEEKAACS